MAQFGCKLPLFVTIVIVAAGGSSACPKSCNCTEKMENDKPGIIVDCKDKGLSTIPSELPQNTTTLDLRDNRVKCGCEFYHRWKILRSKGVEILGKCIGSQQQSGPSFKNLNNEYFNCGSSVFQVTSMESTSVAVSAANVESSSVVGNMDITSVLDASSVVASAVSSTAGAYMGRNPSSSSHVASELVSDGTIKTSKTSSALELPLSEYTAKLSPSSLVTTTRTIPRISTSSLLRSTATSSAKIDWHSTAWTAPPLQSTGFESHTISASPTATSIINTTATATLPPTVHGPPVIVKFEEQRVVNIDEMVQVKCDATGHPRPKIHMTFNTRSVKDAEDVTVTSPDSETEIEFKAIRNSEVYCEATNEVGRDKRKMKILVKQNGTEYLLLKVELIKEDFDENMKNKGSKEFQDMAERITKEVRSVLGPLPSFLDVSVVKLNPGSVKADILVKTLQDTDDSVRKRLKAEVDNAKIGNLAVDRYYYTIEQSQGCPSTFENVTWNDAVYGDFDVQPCPRGAKGFAKRNCSSGGFWYYPDYTSCKSVEFENLRNQVKQYTSGIVNNENVERNILTSLENLFNLSTPNEDFAMMAGDVAISAEILEFIVDYITKENQDDAHSSTEVKHVINVANSVLHRNNEQEFIVAQKLLQTASRFIRVLETYGLQAARVTSFEGDRNLEIFISENVVMGAGKADPESISKDVIFPNYEWAELAKVQQQWNVTTFVVLSQKVIKSMNPGKNGIRFAGFLYRTLTRILSFESAYSDKGMAFEINSAVISASTDPKPDSKLTDPVIIASSNLQEVDLDGDEPICAFWDFNMNAPHGGWSKEGCNTSSYNRMRTTCRCDHMTNFAVLRNRALPPNVQKITSGISDFIHCLLIACWIIIAFAGITFLLLLILSPWLKPDRTWVMHMCVCASILVAFVLILLGLASYNDLELCNLLSFLVHYFFLCSFSWILAESVYMRTWDTENGPKKKYWIGYFLLGWGLPGIPMLITWFINKLSGFESYLSCWMSLFNPLIWLFFIPALVFFVVTCVIFVIVWRAVTGLPRQKLKADYRKTRFRVHIRYCIILMLMFMITWLVGILLITYYWKALLCVLFIICCVITGFMLLLFYVIMDRQVRDAFRQCCCYCKRGRRGSYWVKGDNVWVQKPPEQLEYQRPEEERLVTGSVEEQPDQERDIELNGRESTHEIEEALLRPGTRPELEERRSLESSRESFEDPFYESLRQSVTVEVQQVPSEPKEEPRQEPIYAKVIKPKPPRHPESDSDDEDLTPEEREARGIRGLTREQVIRMAKKSDASKRVLKDYESPSGSAEILDPNQPVYLLNQQEMDEELKHFRAFFAQSEPPTTSTPTKEEGASTSLETTDSFVKRETSTSVTRTQFSSFSSQTDQSSVVHKRYDREESTSSSITKKIISQESQETKSTFQKTVGTSLKLEETAIDSSLEELEQRADGDGNDSSSKPTAVSGDNEDLRVSLLSYFTAAHHGHTEEDEWRDLFEALKE
ncbi:brain-specific angiogenesis inhibitor 1-like isoform X2 [Orbicella faveolata]|uniref:brain-specific angiogenesis inhibitor 1-like isoform X2 n=1 Tax=Orbicella faveolata TaxID=48498 RepID=UPI0009E3D82D|nr:brain-specific angiogenesis inhibitor 1-like isoform X2 [Orbicella faveolata]